MSKVIITRAEFFHYVSKLRAQIAIALEQRCKIYFDFTETNKFELFCMEHIWRIKEGKKTKYVYRKPHKITSEDVLDKEGNVLEKGIEITKSHQNILVGVTKHENLGEFESEMVIKFKAG